MKCYSSQNFNQFDCLYSPA